MMHAFTAVLGRDIRLAVRHGGDLFVPVAFFVLAVLLFPFGIGPEPSVLERVAPGIIWVTALLSSMLSLDRLFAVDHDDGSLDQLILSPAPLPTLVLAKTLAHWFVSGIPLVLVSPLLGLILNLETNTISILIIVMVLGTPTLSLIGAVGASLALGTQRGGLLISLLVLPFCLPILVFGIAAIDASLMGFSHQTPVLILVALLLATCGLCPWITAFTIKRYLS